MPDNQNDTIVLLPEIVDGQEVVHNEAEHLSATQRLLLKYSKEALWGTWLIGLAGVEGYRYTQRESNGPGLEALMSNEYWFNHSGDGWETAGIAFGARGLIETVDLLRVRAGNEAWSPRIKMWVSLIAGMAFPIVVESLGLGIGGNTPGFDAEKFGPFVADAMGPIITGVLAGGSWELVNFLTDSLSWARGKALAERYGQKWADASSKVGLWSDEVLNSLGGLSERIRLASDKILSDNVRSPDPIKGFGQHDFKMPEWLSGTPNEIVDRVIGSFQRIWRSRNDQD